MAYQGCIHRLFFTHDVNKAAADHSDKKSSPPSTQTTAKMLDWALSSSDTEFILNKFNKSPAFELMKIKYISQTQANAIVAHRDENGEFEKVDDLLKLPKIGPKRLQTICDNILSQSTSDSVTDEKLVFSPEDEQTILHRLNTSTEQELFTVDAIGKATTKIIVEHRQKHGLFESVDDLLKVRRIGRGRLQQICRSILNPIISKKAPPDKEYVHDLARLQVLIKDHLCISHTESWLEVNIRLLFYSAQITESRCIIMGFVQKI